MSRELPTDQIDMRADARAIDLASVDALADSIGAVGLINPIRVRASNGRWEVIAGSHRLAACRKLGLVEIESIIVDDDDLHAELAMIDENLCRAELSPADRARQTFRRKEIYEELNGKAKAIGAAAANAVMGNDANANLADAFSSETAKLTGLSQRSVQRDAQRGQAIVPSVLQFITGTLIDTGEYLDKLRKTRSGDQMTMAKRDLATAKQKARERERDRAQGGIARRVVSLADEPLSDAETKAKWMAAGQAWWNRAPQEWREEFDAWKDAPIMDRSFGT